MIAFHCYRVYNIAKEYENKKSFVSYECLMNTSALSHHYRHPLYRHEPKRKLKQEQRLLHRTIRQSSSIFHRRTTKTPRTFYNSTPPSISYPFVRRRNDGGRARTAFALYGLPFPTSQIHRTATVSSSSSLVAKALVH